MNVTNDNSGYVSKQDTSRPTSLHDKRHKELFSNKKSFISLLKDCVREPWVDDVDEDSLVQSPNSFILQDFSEKEADVVYEAKLKGSSVVFYVLLELQSKVDYRMPYRLLLYMVEILRYYYQRADTNERDNKAFKFPMVFPIVFFSGKDTWTVPLNLRNMFANAEVFGNYAMNFEYMLVNAKGYDKETLKNFRSRLLGIILLLEKARNDVEFFSVIRDNLEDIEDFDEEEKRVLTLCIKILDIAYGYNNGGVVNKMLEENKIAEVDGMLCDMIENAKLEKEQLIAQGVSQGISRGISQGISQGVMEVAKAMVADNFPIDVIMRITKLSREQLKEIGA